MSLGAKIINKSGNFLFFLRLVNLSFNIFYGVSKRELSNTKIRSRFHRQRIWNTSLSLRWRKNCNADSKFKKCVLRKSGSGKICRQGAHQYFNFKTDQET